MSGRRIMIGTVKGAKTQKTRTVMVEQFYVHHELGKRLKRFTTCYVHDEFNASHLGDLVEIMECRPRSRLKRWELVKIVKRGGHEADVERRVRVNRFHGVCDQVVDWLAAVYLNPTADRSRDDELRNFWNNELRSFVYRDPRNAHVFQAFLSEPSPKRRSELATCLYDAIQKADSLPRSARQFSRAGSLESSVSRPISRKRDLPLEVRIKPPAQGDVRVGRESLWTLDVFSTPHFPGLPAPRRQCLEFSVEHETARRWPTVLLVPFGLARPQRRDFVVVPMTAGKLALRVDCRYAGHVLACVEQVIEVQES